MMMQPLARREVVFAGMRIGRVYDGQRIEHPRALLQERPEKDRHNP
jgi:hypothetical protein